MKEEQKHSNKRIKLEELPRKQIYEVPAGYFDELPMRIQERVTAGNRATHWQPTRGFAWKLALPVVALLLMVAYFGIRLQRQDIDVAAMLDEVPTEVMIAYLEESDLSTEEFLSVVDLEDLDLDAMLEQETRLLDDSEVDALLEDLPEDLILEDEIL